VGTLRRKRPSCARRLAHHSRCAHRPGNVPWFGSSAGIRKSFSTPRERCTSGPAVGDPRAHTQRSRRAGRRQFRPGFLSTSMIVTRSPLTATTSTRLHRVCIHPARRVGVGRSGSTPSPSARCIRSGQSESSFHTASFFRRGFPGVAVRETSAGQPENGSRGLDGCGHALFLRWPTQTGRFAEPFFLWLLNALARTPPQVTLFHLVPCKRSDSSAFLNPVGWASQLRDLSRRY